MKNLSKDYANALFQIAEVKENTKEIFEDFNVIWSIIKKYPTYIKILCSPDIMKSERVKIVDEAFSGKINTYLTNFLKVLAENRHIYLLSECLGEYTELYNKKYNIIKVKAITAVIMSQEQKDKLRLKLEGMTGKKVILSNYVDPLCLGGIKIMYDDNLIDLSLRSTLSELRTSFETADLKLIESW